MSGLWNWRSRMRQREGGGGGSKRLGPKRASRSATSVSASPVSPTPSRSATDPGERPCHGTWSSACDGAADDMAWGQG